jgi:hypothetical protein
MAYLNSMVAGAKLAFVVGLVLAVSNGLTQRISPSKRTLEAIVNDQLGRVGA